MGGSKEVGAYEITINIMGEENNIHISLKMQKALELFEKPSVKFSEFMSTCRYTSPISAWEAVWFLINKKLINVAFINSTFIKI